MVWVFSSGVCSELMYLADIPLLFNDFTWSRIKAINGENITVTPEKNVAGN